MLSRVNLVAILLTLSYVIRAIECSESPRVKPQEKNGVTAVATGDRILEYAHGNATSEGPAAPSTTDARVVVVVAKDKPAETRRVRDDGAYPEEFRVEKRGN